MPLSPLPYQRAVAAILERENPNAFRSLMATGSSDSTVLEQALLRTTYRLDPIAHPELHAAASRAALLLGIQVPVDLYADEASKGSNAELIFVPSRAVLIFSGETLNILDDTELCAVAGHELAHHVLWTAEGGSYLATSRLLDAAESDARTPSEYLETARRLRLATELFADRGALQACGGELIPTISGLLKMTTGLRIVDPEAYLRQAAEVDFGQASSGVTHPETVLRAWALQQWLERPETADDAIAAALAPQLDLSSIDIVAQDDLRSLTRDLIAAVLSTETLNGESEIELAEHYGVLPTSAGTLPRLDAATLTEETKRYLAAVLVDFATADPDGGQESQAQLLALAIRVGLGSDTEKLLFHELGMSDRTRNALLDRVKQIGSAT